MNTNKTTTLNTKEDNTGSAKTKLRNGSPEQNQKRIDLEEKTRGTFEDQEFGKQEGIQPDNKKEYPGK